MQQDVVRSAGVKRDAELLCQAARFLFALPAERMNLKPFSFQQRDQHSGCAPRAEHTDSRQHGRAAQRDFTCEPSPSSLAPRHQIIH